METITPASPEIEPVAPPSGAGGSSRPPRSVLASLPRRQQINKGAATSSMLSLPPKRQYQASMWRTIVRLVLWLRQISRFFLGNFYARLRGRSNLASQAIRLRRMLESMGPTAIKMGQQLSIRADLLPHEYCDELSKMLDSVPPFPVEQAIQIIEETTGLKLDRAFETFDPVPIGSASLSCVYQARLPTGELVAVKVKRPGIGMQMAADLNAISWLCNFAELIGLVRSGLTRNFQIELTRMLTEELDFTLEARYTEIFRRDTKKHKYISAPRVYHHLSNFHVLVTEFVAGAFLGEILYAIERKDRQSLDELLARGFRPKLIARRMLHIFWWECFESRFFHADPHPSNIIVRPDNTLVMIDFGSCGAVSSRVRRKLLAFNRAILRDDLHGMVQTTVSMLEPLPHFDVESFSQALLTIYREGFIAHKSRNAPWYDKCSGGMWMKVIVVSQKFNLPMTLDTVRIFRANFLYDSIVFRLHVDLDPQKEFGDFHERLDRKNRQRVLRGVRERLCGPLDSDFTREVETRQMFETAMERFQHFLDEPRYNFAFTIGKMAYVVAVFIKSALLWLGFLLATSAGRIGYVQMGLGQPPISVPDALAWTLSNKLVLGFLFVFGIVTLRKLLMKLQDVDVDRAR